MSCLLCAALPTCTVMWATGKLWAVEDTTNPKGLVVWVGKITMLPKAEGVGCFS